MDRPMFLVFTISIIVATDGFYSQLAANDSRSVGILEGMKLSVKGKAIGARLDEGVVSSMEHSPFICPQKCVCQYKNFLVNCSKRQLSRVPFYLPNETRILLLDHNQIKSLNNTNFRNVTQLTVLDLSSNRIGDIATGSFVGLTHLRSLNLSYNPLHPLTRWLFSPLSELQELNLSSTRVAFNNTAFVNLTKLRRLVFRENRLSKFPQFVYDNKSLLPNLSVLDLDHNDLEAIYSAGLESLESLTLGDNRIIALPSDTLSGFKNLKYVAFYKNKLYYVDERAFCSKSLLKLDIGLSEFMLSLKTQDVFRCLPNLEELQMKNCKISMVKHPFRNLVNLRRLNVARSGINNRNVNLLLTDLKKLEYLSLQSNSISFLSRDMFESFKDTIKILAVGSNKISTVNKTSLPKELWTNLEKIDLSNNPFNCDCELAWFLNWIKTTNVTISHLPNDPKQYQCSAPEEYRKKPLSELKHPTELECFIPPIDWYLLSVFLTVVAIVLISTLSTVLFRFRWYVKYWYFRYKIQEREAHRTSENIRQYQYDAFVCYSKQDVRWVVRELRRRLEAEDNLRLCLHDRDFLAGEDIYDNVVSSIENSRKVLLIVSNAFAESQWCHFELVMVQTKVIASDRDNLILIILEEIHDMNMTPRLKLQMEKQTYLEWTNNSVGQELFWARLRQALGKSSNSVIDSTLPREMFTDQ